MLLTDSITTVKGIGDKTAKLFNKLHITRVCDLLFYLPKGFERFSDPTQIDKGYLDSICVFKGKLRGGTMRQKKAGRYHITTCLLECNDTVVHVTYFNVPYLSKVLQPGQEYIFRGILKQKNDVFTMQQPKHYTMEEYTKMQGSLMPVYGLTKGLTGKTIQKTVKAILEKIQLPPDYLAEHILLQNQLLSMKEALLKVHFPQNEQDFYYGRKRLAFHEFFTFLEKMRGNRSLVTDNRVSNPMLITAHTARFIEKLPFSLTEAQTQAWKQIEDDLQKDYAMNRLLQGDVGSGKTIIAFLALLMTAANNRQGCLMAPTEILAQQHFASLCEYIEKYQLPINPVLLLGSMTAKEKKCAKEGIESGVYQIIIGTHALIQSGVNYKNLALVITDEQHRFGVKQRESLAEKGNHPHILVMSATPIPRTLALILYGDLSITTMRELPSNRLPIKNCVVNTAYRETAYKFMQKEIAMGHQIYIICPMVEACEAMEELENVVEYTEKIKNVFPSHIMISYVHGKMSLSEKNAVMEAFSEKKIDILVSTTVIEVGINVPNATVMMVENAERFGLAQLHQLRGRVGRGDAQSYCIFMSGNDSAKNKERLEVLNYSNDGFEIAEKDLKLRGPGELTGYRQSGDLGFQIGDIYEDSDMLQLADRLQTEISSSKEEEYAKMLQNLQEFDSLNAVDFRTI